MSLTQHIMMYSWQLGKSLKRQPADCLIMVLNINLTQFVKELFADSTNELTIAEIYNAVEGNCNLSAFQKEYTKYGEPRFQHETRAIINQLFQNGEVVRTGRGIYKKREL